MPAAPLAIPVAMPFPAASLPLIETFMAIIPTTLHQVSMAHMKYVIGRGFNLDSNDDVVKVFGIRRIMSQAVVGG
jgi:hypothetical protein